MSFTNCSTIIHANYSKPSGVQSVTKVHCIGIFIVYGIICIGLIKIFDILRKKVHRDKVRFCFITKFNDDLFDTFLQIDEIGIGIESKIQ